MDQLRFECPLTGLTNLVTKYNWLHVRKDTLLNLENIEIFQTLSFESDNTFEYRVKSYPGYDVYKQAMGLKMMDRERYCSTMGTWSIRYFDPENILIQYILTFHDE